jgi:hypothetical protein
VVEVAQLMMYRKERQRYKEREYAVLGTFSFFSPFPLLFHPDPQPMGWCCPHLGQVFSPELILSGDVPTDTPRNMLY